MHEQEAAAQGWTCRYELLDLDRIAGGAAALPSLIERAERDGFAGLNITHPCKESVLPYLDTVSDEARNVGAVNTIVFTGGRRVGHNTDWSGFSDSFRRGLPGAALDRVLQLGAGGAGAATAYAALRVGVTRLDIVDAIPTRAEALAARMNAHFPGRATATRNAASVIVEAGGLIHATPTGMASYPGLPIAGTLLQPRLWVADVVYFPLENELLRVARDRGCRTLDGSGMAIWQAAHAFRLFTGATADPERMRRCFEAAAGA